MFTPEDAVHFWSKVAVAGPDDCWLWKFSVLETGYGQHKVRGTGYSAHRFAFMVSNGEIPEGLLVCHRCDVRACCNPTHLFLGTHGDNNRDTVAKGRWRSGWDTFPERMPHGDRHWMRLYPEKLLRGSKNSQARLTESSVVRLREQYSKGRVTMNFLAQKYAVSKNTIRRVVRMETWTHLPSFNAATTS